MQIAERSCSRPELHAGLVAYLSHGKLINLAADMFSLDYSVSNVTPFQNSFFSVLSLLFAIFSGNSMAFLYDVRAAAAAPSFCKILVGSVLCL